MMISNSIFNLEPSGWEAEGEMESKRKHSLKTKFGNADTRFERPSRKQEKEPFERSYDFKMR